MAAKGRKVCIIGLDGATFTVLDKWVASGDMPNLAGLMERGSRGILMSSIPPVTGPAWTSMTTGVNPGKHGVLDFFRWNQDGKTARLSRSSDVAVPRVWDLVARGGHTVGVYNVPATYPAWDVNGFMVTGMLTPKPCEEMTWPRALFAELSERDMAKLLLAPGPVSETEYARQVLRTHRERHRTVEFLLKRQKPDFFMGVFVEPDRIQHHVWAVCTDPDGSHNAGTVRVVREFYRAIDETIGMLVGFYGDEAAYFVTSDHGFGPLRMRFALNRYFIQKGFLALKQGEVTGDSFRRRFMSTAKAVSTKLGLLGLARKLRNLTRPEPLRVGGWRKGEFDRISRLVDWDRTVACVKSKSDAGVSINVRGRYECGIVEPGDECEKVVADVISALQELENPLSGGPLVTHILRREEALNGPFVELAPDLYVVMANGNIERSARFAGPLFEDSDKSATHRMEGVLVAAGPGIKARTGLYAQLMDVAPTALYAMGLPVPRWMEGRVLKAIFDDADLASSPPEYYDDDSVSRAVSSGAEDAAGDDSAVMENLRRLGYL